ncbi:hypothetical protein RSOLAG1IB_10133 [Rhizoctonia solani AG-1 IB]|uniref:Hemerythrin-like domain-containing protein n=1 Tax=Thanatephorus cucumeris (strain AG1-IB / isolate 7/3/14) TaxID=1108050 RepID=A0A0B7FV66_THACB|nr:hypothetical protein RSOLAG1IB_10133 [Rhizoctonia solani AG-1 IB]
MCSLSVIPTIPGIPTDLSTIDYVEAYPYDTAFMHNCLIRAFNQIGAASMKVLPVEMVNFVKYVDAFCETLRRHCEGENKIIFPRLSASIALDGEDNKELLGFLERVENWVQEAVRIPEKVDLIELVTAMEIMAPVLSKNMHGQVNHMSSSALRSSLSGPELRALVNDDIAWIAQNSRMEYFLPFLVLHHDFSTNEAWPGLPDEAKSALPELVAANSECWNYAPFNLSGQPQR